LALAVVGGLTSSTFLSLFLVPVMFLIFARLPAADEDEVPHHAPAAAGA
jgi:Cu/Ag efflux pump CusA